MIIFTRFLIFTFFTSPLLGFFNPSGEEKIDADIKKRLLKSQNISINSDYPNYTFCNQLDHIKASNLGEELQRLVEEYGLENLVENYIDTLSDNIPELPFILYCVDNMIELSLNNGTQLLTARGFLSYESMISVFETTNFQRPFNQYLSKEIDALMPYPYIHYLQRIEGEEEALLFYVKKFKYDYVYNLMLWLIKFSLKYSKDDTQLLTIAILSYKYRIGTLYSPLLRKTAQVNNVLDSILKICTMLPGSYNMNIIDGNSRLHLACLDCMFDSSEIITTINIPLIKNNFREEFFSEEQFFDINKPNSQGLTPLMLMLFSNKPRLFDLFKKLGANLEMTNNNGDTVLTFATKLGKILAVEELIALGANKDHKNHQGLTAFEIAQEKLKEEPDDYCAINIIKILLK